MIDTDAVELIGRQRLIEELLRGGLGVAVPMRKGAIDLVAYAEPGLLGSSFLSCPIQMKASAGRSFSIDQSSADIPNLLHVYVWGVATDQCTIFALTDAEARSVAEAMGYTFAQSGQRGLYGQRPTRNLVELLERYRMTPERWRARMEEAAVSPDRTEREFIAQANAF